MNHNIIKNYIQELTDADTVKEYEDIILRLNESLMQEACPLEVFQKVKGREKYVVNRFSDESTKENMRIAASFGREGGYFCVLLLSLLPMAYPRTKQVRYKPSTEIKKRAKKA